MCTRAHTLSQKSHLDGVEDVRLVGLLEVDGFGIAPTLEVKDAIRGVPPSSTVDEVVKSEEGRRRIWRRIEKEKTH